MENKKRFPEFWQFDGNLFDCSFYPNKKNYSLLLKNTIMSVAPSVIKIVAMITEMMAPLKAGAYIRQKPSRMPSSPKTSTHPQFLEPSVLSEKDPTVRIIPFARIQVAKIKGRSMARSSKAPFPKRSQKPRTAERIPPMSIHPERNAFGRLMCIAISERPEINMEILIIKAIPTRLASGVNRIRTPTPRRMIPDNKRSHFIFFITKTSFL